MHDSARFVISCV